MVLFSEPFKLTFGVRQSCDWFIIPHAATLPLRICLAASVMQFSEIKLRNKTVSIGVASTVVTPLRSRHVYHPQVENHLMLLRT